MFHKNQIDKSFHGFQLILLATEILLRAGTSLPFSLFNLLFTHASDYAQL